MNAKDLKTLRNKLPKSWAATIASSTGKSKVYVWQVLNGKERHNDEIIDAAIELAKENKDKEAKRLEQIKSL